MARIVRRIFISVVLVAVCVPPAFAAPGDLDPAFGDGGILRLELADFSNADTAFPLPSGRILAGGAIGETGQGGTRDFLLMHTTTDGVLDAAFGTDGVVADSILDPGPEELTRLLVQPDGKIVGVGFGMDGLTFENIVARYNTDGTRDSNFGEDGVIFPSPGFAIALDQDGNILIGNNGAADEFTVTRYTPEGVLDAGFGVGGTVASKVGPASTVGLRALGVDAEGRIVAVSKADDVDAVVRLLADGSPDTDFGTGGFTFNFCNDDDSPSDFGFQSDGRIVVVASTRVGGNNRLCLLRFTAEGGVDNDFDADGKVISDIPGVTKETPAGLDIMKDDRIVVGGEVDAAGGDSAFFAARYEANGTPDATFSGDGFAFVDVTPGDTDFGADVAVLNDGRVIVPGASIREGSVGLFDATLVVFQGDLTDLSLSVLASRTEATVGDGAPVTFTVTAVNNGPLAAHGVQVVDSVPSVLTVTSASSTHGACSSGPKVVCDLGILEPSEDATVIVNATPSSAGSAVNAISVSGQIGDLSPGDNAASATITVSASGGGTASTGGGGGSGGGCQLVR
ncbi:MAG TPA: hypothetical protein VFX30_04185 [bacterium]|nr:hypothetical protein [bacterium]